MAIINKETIISAFDDQMTLVQWLKKLENVLNTSTLSSIRTIKVENTKYKIELSFEDGTKIESDIIQLQSEITNIKLTNGHLIFTLMNGDTIDAGLIDVSNLGSVTIYGDLLVTDGEASFGSNVEIDGALVVNSTLQVGDTITNEDELAKLPRTLLAPLTIPTEQKLVGIDTANGQNLLNIGNGLLVDNETMRVGGNVNATSVHANEIVENMNGYYFRDSTRTGYNVSYVYAGIVKNGNKLTICTAFKITKLMEDAESNPTICYYQLPSSVLSKLFPTSIGGNNMLDTRLVYAYSTGTDYLTVQAWFTKSTETINLSLRGFKHIVQTGVEYYIRHEITFLLSENLANQVGELD